MWLQLHAQRLKLSPVAHSLWWSLVVRSCVGAFRSVAATSGAAFSALDDFKKCRCSDSFLMLLIAPRMSATNQAGLDICFLGS
jgi:hypothetical protein